MLNKLFSSKTRAKILTLFFTNPEKRFYQNELREKLRERLSVIQHELKRLEEIGLLQSDKEGNRRYYSLDKKNPLFPELRSIVLKTTAVGDILRKEFKRIGKIRLSFIYGSFASGQEYAKSDIDLMIIGQIDLRKLNNIISRLESKIGREINYSLYSVQDIQKRKKEKDDFILSVLKEKKIILVGDENDELFDFH